jgi:WD40 repeat protein
MNLEKPNFNFELSVVKNGQFLLGILNPFLINFATIKPFKIIKQIKAKKESFLHGTFRKNDGKMFAVSNRKGNLDLLSLSSMKLLRSFNHFYGKIYSTSFSDNGLQLISGGDSGIIKLWDIREQRCSLTIQGSKNMIKQVSFLPKHNCITGFSSYDNKIRIFDLRCNKKITEYKFGFPVESFKFFQDQKFLVGIGGNSIKFWDIRTGSILFSKSENSSIRNISSPENGSIMYITSDKMVRYLRTEDFKFLLIGSYKNRVLSAEFLGNGIFIGFDTGKILIKNKKRKINFNTKTTVLRKSTGNTKQKNDIKCLIENDFLPALNIFRKKNLKIYKRSILKGL